MITFASRANNAHHAGSSRNSDWYLTFDLGFDNSCLRKKIKHGLNRKFLLIFSIWKKKFSQYNSDSEFKAYSEFLELPTGRPESSKYESRFFFNFVWTAPFIETKKRNQIIRRNFFSVWMNLNRTILVTFRFWSRQ